jgi:hypothetical protein
MDLVRSDLGLALTRSRFPKKGTCLAIYSYSVNTGCPLEETPADAFPWCDEWEAELKRDPGHICLCSKIRRTVFDAAGTGDRGIDGFYRLLHDRRRRSDHRFPER